MSTVQTVHPTNKVMLAIFWLYVTIPLAWGVVNTISQSDEAVQVKPACAPRDQTCGAPIKLCNVRNSARDCPAPSVPLRRTEPSVPATTGTPRRRRPSSWPS